MTKYDNVLYLLGVTDFHVILPVSPADADLVPPLAKLFHAFAKKGNYSFHRPEFRLTILQSPRVEIDPADLDGFSGAMSAGNFSIRTLSPAMDVERGWPRSPNLIFAAAARLAWETRREGRGWWYFFEADNTPMRPDWAGLLLQERLRVDSDRFPYMGAVNKTYSRMVGVGASEDGSSGVHLVGTGIYPSEAHKKLRLLKHVPMTSQPFDVFLQWEIMKAGCADIPELIQHNWGTSDYRRQKDGRIVCSVSDTRSPFPGRDRYAVPVRDGVAVVHGCKDGSLARLVLEDTDAPAPATDSAPARTRSAPARRKRRAKRKTGRVMVDTDNE